MGAGITIAAVITVWVTLILFWGLAYEYDQDISN